jgi:hypothetical protein
MFNYIKPKGGKMHGYIRASLVLGALFCWVVFGALIPAGGLRTAHAQYSFTYTSEDTVKSGALWDTTEFHAILTNTGTLPDTYLVTLTELTPTPEEWWTEICVNGICQDSLTTQVEVYLPAGAWEDEYLHVMPRTSGTGRWTITVESYGNPGSKLTLQHTYVLTAYYGPVTNKWGMIALVVLIMSSGLYLLQRKYRLVRQRQI